MREGIRATGTLVLSCLAMFVVVLDATIVVVALPDIRGELGVPQADLAWVVNAYTLLFAGFLLFGGRCADVFGPRRTMLVGVAVFTVGSVTAGLASSTTLLLSARAVQGLGGALLMPTTLASLTLAYTGPARTRALATWSTVGAAGGAVGTVLGGVLTQLLGWRWVFLVNVPFGLVSIVLPALVLPDRSPGTGGGPRLDVAGAVVVTLGLTAVVLGVMSTGVRGWTDASVLVTLGAGAALLAVFLAISSTDRRSR